MADVLRIVVIGAGDVGWRHLHVIESLPQFKTIAVVDPAPRAKLYANERDILHADTDFESVLDKLKPDGVLIATPNSLHLHNALGCIARGIPILLEKPITETVESAMEIVRAADAAGVPVLVGHHRRYNPLIETARAFIADGKIGRVTAVNGTWFRRKPDDYFRMEWRRMPGGGPLLINAIHDIDSLRVICGEIESVQAMTANAARGFAVEDTAGFLMRFRSGAIGTFILSDAVQGPWGWEQSAWENAAWYPQQPVDCYIIGGTEGSLTVPTLEHWRNEGGGGRADPLVRKRLQVIHADPHVAQWRHFGEVIRGRERPRVSAIEATRTLATVLAIAKAAQTQMRVDIKDI